MMGWGCDFGITL